MKNPVCKLFLFFLFVFAFSSKAALCQQVKLSALPVKQSNLINDLISFKNANPGASLDELIKTANDLIDKQGFNYAFVFDENTCQSIAAARKKQTDPSAPLNLNANLNSVAGERTSLVLPAEQYDKSECGRCFVYLPVWEAAGTNFVTFIRGISVKFYLPANFYLNEVALVDDSDLTKVVRRWKTPFRATPLSVSDDGKILYVGLPQKELSDLALMIFDEGVVQFYARKDVEPDKKGTLLKDVPKDTANPSLSFINFEKGEIKQTIRFSSPCAD